MKFRSKYTNEDYDITPAQYLAEFLSERKAKKDGKNLPVKFWNVPPFKGTFFQQMKLANKLLKEYDVRIILTALRELKYVYSLANKKLLAKIKELDSKKKAEEARAAIQPIVTLMEDAFGLDVTVVQTEPVESKPKRKSQRGLLE